MKGTNTEPKRKMRDYLIPLGINLGAALGLLYGIIISNNIGIAIVIGGGLGLLCAGVAKLVSSKK